VAPGSSHCATCYSVAAEPKHYSFELESRELAAELVPLGAAAVALQRRGSSHCGRQSRSRRVTVRRFTQCQHYSRRVNITVTVTPRSVHITVTVMPCQHYSFELESLELAADSELAVTVPLGPRGAGRGSGPSTLWLFTLWHLPLAFKLSHSYLLQNS
jgi:hypothetical protein